MAAPEKPWWVVSSQGDEQLVFVSQKPWPPGAIYRAGPFLTRKAANDWIADRNSPVHGKSPSPQPVPIAKPLSDIGKIGHWIGDAVLHVVDLPMWRSIGWLALGLMLVFAGIYLWFRTSATYKDLQSAVLGTVKAL